MAIRFRESPESRELNYGANSGGTTLLATAITNAGENEAQVWLWALASTTPYFNGFIRNNIRVRPKGASHIWSVEVEYGTTGIGGGDQPLGGVGNDNGPPPSPTAPAAPNEPLKAGWSFSIRAPKLVYTQSRATLDSAKRGGGDPTDYKGRVGVDRDGKTLGVEWPPEPSITFKRTVPMANVTLDYIETLALLAGRTNNAEWYGFDTECVLFLEADGQFTEGEKWSVTFGFGVELAETDIEIIPGELPFPPKTISKQGWQWMWIREALVPGPGGRMTTHPDELFIEQLVRPADFGLLGIGT